MNQREFKKDLRAIMEKHNIDYIGIDFDDCSDTHGMTGVQVVAETKCHKTIVLCSNGSYGVDQSDLKQ